VISITPNSRILEIDTSYTGGLGLNQLLVIEKVTLYYDDVQVTNEFVNPIEISGPSKISIPIAEELQM
jgi:hypothetical protein